MSNKAVYKRFNGTAWETYWFETTADMILETDTYKVLTASERAKIADNLTTFQTPTNYGSNAPNKIVKSGADGLIAPEQIKGGLPYLTINNPTFTGKLKGTTVEGSDNLTLQNANGGGKITLSDDGVEFYGAAYNFAGANLIVDGQIKGLVSPTDAADAATKAYVDNVSTAGLKVASNGPVKVATTENITLTGLQKIDGVDVVAEQRVLVWKQTTASQNGIYTVKSGAWVKDATDSVQGKLVFVETGNTHNDWLFVNTDGTVWAEFTKPDTITPGSGLSKTGTTLSISTSGVTNAMLAGSIASSKLANVTPVQTLTVQPAEVGAPVAASFETHMSNIYSIIKDLKGTNHWNSATQSMATIINTKNRTYTGTTDPSAGAQYNDGDLYFQTVV